MGNLTLLGGLRGTKLEFPPYWSPGVPKARGLGRGLGIISIFGFLFFCQFRKRFCASFGYPFRAFWDSFWKHFLSKNALENIVEKHVEIYIR